MGPRVEAGEVRVEARGLRVRAGNWPVGMQSVQILFATLTGFVAGAVFALMDAPIPAPPKLAGVMGIVGIYAGYKAIQHFDLIGLVADAFPL